MNSVSVQRIVAFGRDYDKPTIGADSNLSRCTRVDGRVGVAQAEGAARVVRACREVRVVDGGQLSVHEVKPLYGAVATRVEHVDQTLAYRDAHWEKPTRRDHL